MAKSAIIKKIKRIMYWTTRRKIREALFWTPRVMLILLTVFVSLLALDVFNMNYDYKTTIITLIIYLVPVYILVFILAVAWKWEYMGAGLLTLVGLAYIWLALGRMDTLAALIIPIIMLITSILFFFDRYLVGRKMDSNVFWWMLIPSVLFLIVVLGVMISQKKFIFSVFIPVIMIAAAFYSRDKIRKRLSDFFSKYIGSK